MPAHRKFDPAILWQAPFGDIQHRHNLDARDNRRLKAPWRRLDLVEHTVIAVTNTKTILERVDVDVRRAGLDRVRDQLIYQTDERGLARQVFKAFSIVRDRSSRGGSRECVEVGLSRCGLGPIDTGKRVFE